MKMLRVVRWSAITGIVLLLAAIAVFEFAPGTRDRVLPHSDGTVSGSDEGAVSVPAGVLIGDAFEPTNDKHHTVKDADYRGRWMLVFFDYTNCPDECPLTLQEMAAMLRDLGPLADRIAPLFITVDPARDTPERLASYLENFDTRITGLTGSDDQIAAVAKAYLGSHSTFLYLMDPSGNLNALFSQDVTPEKLTAALRTRLSSPQQSAQSTRGHTAR